MFTRNRLIGGSLMMVFFAGAALAQETGAPIETSRNSVPAAPLVTATGSPQRVRFVAPGTVVQLRLEVFDESGQKVFDTELHGGNVLDWHLQNGAGSRLPAGSYACVLTIKSLSGRLNQRIGLVSVNENQVTVGAPETQLSTAQQQVIGPVESNAAFTLLPNTKEDDMTAVAHDGTDGQLTRTRGALSFRVGDLFSGTDQEQMRLTEAGNLGIGTDKPEARLDVAGTVRAREGFLFGDGSKLSVKGNGGLQLTSADGAVVPNAAGTGTQNRVAKWIETGGSGTLGDSLISETNGNVVVGNAGQTGNIQIFGTAVQDVFAGMGPDVTNGPAFNYGYAGGSFGRSAGFFNVRPDASATAPNPSLRFMTANVERMIITNLGRVGIGTSTPGNKLDVAGDINTSTQYNIGGNRVLTVGFDTLFVGKDAGPLSTGDGNTFVGFEAGQRDTSGNVNSFFGAAAGFNNTIGAANVFFGHGTGSQNVSGNSNTFLGFHAGDTYSAGDNNTLIGAEADLGANNLSFATAVGSFARVSTSNTIVLGRADASDVVDVPGKLQIDTMGTGGGQALCLNASNRVALCTSSSLRYKTHVTPFLGGLDIVRRLRPISFTWKEDGQRDLGLGAEEVEQVAPLLTFRNNKGTLEGVKYNQLSAVFINAFKEQQQQITQQQLASQEQQKQIATLRIANLALHARLRLIERTLRTRHSSTRHHG